MSQDQFFVRGILEWFAREKRDLPWRKTQDPYAIWVSEVMLQQTQVDRVKNFYYDRFLKKFPTVASLAAGSWEELMEVWRGLGYYRRARSMQKAAQFIVDEFGGKFPQTVEDLEKLPGVGKYTARAVASFAYGADVPVKDTNVSRVLMRFFEMEDEAVWGKMESLVPVGDSSNFNQGVMELGALACGSAAPKCEKCPLQQSCNFYQSGKTADLLVREKKVKYKIPSGVTRVAIGLVYRNGKLLVMQEKNRPNDFYGFPGGKLEKRESERTALKREIQEELGIEVSVRPAFFRTDFEYEKGKPLHLSFHRCQILLGEPQPLEGQKIDWASPKDLSQFSFWPANKDVLEKIPKMRW